MEQLRIGSKQKKHRDLSERVLKGMIYLSAFITVGMLLWILSYIVVNGIKEVSWEFLTTSPKGEEGGILPMILNTIYIIVLALMLSTPIGVLSAIYLVEYAKPGKTVRFIRFCTESLAGIPSIIYGLFGLIFFVTLLKWQFSMISGAVTLSIMVLPTMIRTTEEALKAIPSGYREASMGLGASKLRTVVKAVLPSALPGIMAAIILNTGRIVGETAAVVMTAGMSPYIAKSASESGRTLAVHMYLLAKEGISFEKAYATATVLVIIVLLINLSTKLVAKLLSRDKDKV